MDYSSLSQSVVFSCWVAHMGLIEIAFKDNGITFVFLDSTMTSTQRNRVMDDFEKSPEISIIPYLSRRGISGISNSYCHYDPAQSDKDYCTD